MCTPRSQDNVGILYAKVPICSFTDSIGRIRTRVRALCNPPRRYYDGHNMTVGGAVACKTKEDYEKIKFYQNMLGNIMSPMVAYLTLQVLLFCSFIFWPCRLDCFLYASWRRLCVCPPIADSCRPV